MIGAPFGAFIASKYGRKIAIIIFSSFFYIIGSIGMFFSTSLNMILIFRFISGIGAGISTSICTVYMCELSPSSLRGSYGSWISFAGTAGIISSYAFAYLLELLTFLSHNIRWRLMFLFSGSGTFVQLIICAFLWLPESPRWLKSKGEIKKANNIYYKLFKIKSYHDFNYYINDNIDDSNYNNDNNNNNNLIDNSYNNNINNNRHKKKKISKLNHFYYTIKKLKLSLIRGIGLNILQQLAGINAIVFFFTLNHIKSWF